MISISEMKFDETTVTGHCIRPSRPTMASAEAPQISAGTATQRRLRKAIVSSTSRNTAMPRPNTRMSSATKSIMSEAIIGTPPRKIVAASR